MPARPDDDLKQMPGRFIMLLLWTAGAWWLLFSAKGRALFGKYLADAKAAEPESPEG